jgi:predicted histone-like DNA-binding protein
LYFLKKEVSTQYHTNMAIKYSVAQRAEAGVKGGGTPKYYAMASKRELVGFRDLAKMIEGSSTVSSADVVAVLYNLAYLIPELIKDGRSVKLDSVGIISGTLVSEGKNSPEEVNSRCITGIKLHFLPDVEMKRSLMNCEFEKVK